MSFGMQGGHSSSESQQGLLPGQRNYFSGLAPTEYGNVKQASTESMADPAGTNFLPFIERLIPSGRYGLPASVDQGMYQLGQDMFSKASASRAARGFNTASNLEGVTGDAIRMVSGQMIPTLTNYALQRAAMAPQLRGAFMGYATTPMQIISNLLSGTGESSASSSNFGFGISAGSGGGGSSGGSSPSALGWQR